MTLIESFIAQNFRAIYKEVCYGVKSQQREYFLSLKDGEGNTSPVTPPTWNLSSQVDKGALLNCIAETLHFLLHAGSIDPKFQEIEDWTQAMLKIACAERSHGIVSGASFRVMINSSEQFTQFLFSHLNWDYPISNHFSERIKFLYEKLGGYEGPGKTKYCKNLLTAMRLQRNHGSHLAEKFYTDRPSTLQRIVYHLYDYITVIFIIRHELGITFQDYIWEKAGKPANLKDLSIHVSCVNGHGQVSAIRLYESIPNGKDVLLNQTSQPAEFTVRRFNRYRIELLLTNGKISQKSERFTVDEGYVNGSEVKVELPPKSVECPKVSIAELLLFTEDDLPDDLRYILEKLDVYQGDGQDCVAVARTLLMASATGNDRDHQAFLTAVSQLKKELTEGTKEQTPALMAEYMSQQAKTIAEELGAPYRETSALELLRKIDELYDKAFSMLKPTRKDGERTIIQQMNDNVEQLLQGNFFSLGTTATAQQVQIERDLAHLQVLLALSREHPEIVEAEFGPHKLTLDIVDLYCNTVNHYILKVHDLKIATINIENYIRQADTDRKDTRYTDMLSSALTFASAEHSLHFAVFGSDLLLRLIDKCQLPQPDEHLDNLKAKWHKALNELREDPANQPNELYVLYPNEKTRSQASEELQKIKRIVEELLKLKEKLRKDLEEDAQREIAAMKGVSGWLWKKINNMEPSDLFELKTDKFSQDQFDTLCYLVNSISETRLLRLLWADEGGALYSLVDGCELMGIGLDSKIPGHSGNLWFSWREDVKAKMRSLMEIVSNLKKLSGGKRERHLGARYVGGLDYLSQKIDIIFKYQENILDRNYADQLPDYIKDIKDAPDLPNYIKISMLRWMLSPLNRTIDLILLMDEALDLYLHADVKSKRVLKPYIEGKYAQELFSDETLANDFPKLTPFFKAMCIKMLMNDQFPNYIADRNYHLNLLLALILNTQYEVVDWHDLFMCMAQYRITSIPTYRDFERLVLSENILDATTVYCSQHPEDTKVVTEHQKQKEDLKKKCEEHIKEHVRIIQPTTTSAHEISMALQIHETLLGERLREIMKDDSQKVVLLEKLLTEKDEHVMGKILHSLYHGWEKCICIPSQDALAPTLKTIRKLLERYRDFIGLSWSPTTFLDCLEECMKIIADPQRWEE